MSSAIRSRTASGTGTSGGSPSRVMTRTGLNSSSISAIRRTSSGPADSGPADATAVAMSSMTSRIWSQRAAGTFHPSASRSTATTSSRTAGHSMATTPLDLAYRISLPRRSTESLPMTTRTIA
jgi:hypothetical protein